MLNMNWTHEPLAVIDESSAARAARRQSELTKPPGSLGVLEALAVRLAGMQGVDRPRVRRPAVVVFAADHGVATEGVSAFPQAVTAEMVRNFARGGAAISVLCRHLGATLAVVNLGTVDAVEPLPGVIDARIAPGTANLAVKPAMTLEQFAIALDAGRDAVDRARADGADLFIGGDMGIANTTSAAALACALTGAAPSLLAGPGTGLDVGGVVHKTEVIGRALGYHGDALAKPCEALRRLGGFEIAALTGACIRCGILGMPILLDGFICSAAALAALRMRPGLDAWMLLAHRSAEPGHAHIADALNMQPLLDLGMRLGEGSGAATALPLLRLACELHNEMATFAEASVSGRVDG